MDTTYISAGLIHVANLRDLNLTEQISESVTDPSSLRLMRALVNSHISRREFNTFDPVKPLHRGDGVTILLHGMQNYHMPALFSCSYFYGCRTTWGRQDLHSG
jgi:hypothetical protein